ncbi:hypothetical protein [Kocuria sp. TGY1127_2]|uniref:hypothetical protein n=1 Tax=Kocuria sp. TGY1127_2 TaxID=2711328 RepID=UPI0015B94DD7|nr:hypothetical protein [Kocuria sp. TGY1127_2]
MKRLTGHRVAMLGIMLIGGSSAFAYSGLFIPPVDSPGPLFLTDDGTLLWVYALAWLVVTVLAGLDFVLNKTTWSVPAFIGILTVWGLSYVGAWIVGNSDRDPWKTALLYLGFAAFVLGKHLEVTRYEKQLTRANKRIVQAMTGPGKQVNRDG